MDETTIVGPGVIRVVLSDAVDTAAATRALAGTIETIPGVLAAGPDVLLGVSDEPRQPQQWAIENSGASSQAAGYGGVAGANVRAPEAWTVTMGAGSVVAVVDSGVQTTHPDLSPNIWRHPTEVCANGADDDRNGFVDDCSGWDFGMGDNNANPDLGPSNADHGTHVAGIIAAAINGVGIAGIAPEADIMPLKVSTTTGGIPTSSARRRGELRRAERCRRRQHVARDESGSGPALPHDRARGGGRQRPAAGSVVVVAMGNDGVDITNAPVWPASYSLYYDNVISVGASTNSDTRASFSNTGSPLSVYAPGFAIMSTLPNGSWDWKWGTSMAAPAVAGGVAAMLAAGTATTPAAVRSMLGSTGVGIGVGKRMDLAAAVGYVEQLPDPALAMTMSGAQSIAADATTTLGFALDSGPEVTAANVRLAVAARTTRGVSAVEGLEATLTTVANGVRTPLGTFTTDARGEFPLLGVSNPAALADDDFTIEAVLSLPAAQYAFAVELADGAAQRCRRR